MNPFLTFEAGERAPQRLRRKALDTADEAIARLDQIDRDGQKAVHDVRRRLKELRALTELVAGALPLSGQPESQLFRDAGRFLSTARDAKAAVEAFERLRERFADQWTPRQFQKIRSTLAHRVDPTVDPAIVDGLRDALTVERGQIAAWPVDEMPRDALWSAITRSYRRARKAMRTAMEKPTAELLHIWRKRTKMHWYHAQFFVSVGLSGLEQHADRLRKLSRILGDHHDLALIRQVCITSWELLGSKRHVRRFQRYVDQRLLELQQNAESEGKDVFEERAKVWEAHAQVASDQLRTRVGPKASPARGPRSPSLPAQIQRA